MSIVGAIADGGKCLSRNILHEFEAFKVTGVGDELGARKQDTKNSETSSVAIWMSEIVSLIKIPAERNKIIRSLEDGPDYCPDWRFRVCEQYLKTIHRAPDESIALEEILSKEKDFVVRELVLFHRGRVSKVAASIEYALRCHRSRRTNSMAGMIQAMIITGRSSAEIAEEAGTTKPNIKIYEKIFFDLRRYHDLRFFIDAFCFSSTCLADLGESMSRWLITALRGWDAFAYTFAQSHSNFTATNQRDSAGKRICDGMALQIFGRLQDFVRGLEMKGISPTEVEVELLVEIQRLMRHVAPTLSQLDYPPALGPKARRKENEKIEGPARLSSAAARRRVTNFLERLTSNPKYDNKDWDKPSDSP